MPSMIPRTSPRQSRFNRWLRTGFWMVEQQADPSLEVKFNPNHDSDTGRFTFANSGGPAANDTKSPGGSQRQPGQEDPRMKAIDEQTRRRIQAADPHNPANYSTYTVQPGDTLTKIAASRTGLSPDGLEWLNDKSDDRLQVGDEIKVPTQAYLDNGKEAAR